MAFGDCLRAAGLSTLGPRVTRVSSQSRCRLQPLRIPLHRPGHVATAKPPTAGDWQGGAQSRRSGRPEKRDERGQRRSSPAACARCVRRAVSSARAVRRVALLKRTYVGRRGAVRRRPDGCSTAPSARAARRVSISRPTCAMASVSERRSPTAPALRARSRRARAAASSRSCCWRDANAAASSRVSSHARAPAGRTTRAAELSSRRSRRSCRRCRFECVASSGFAPRAGATAAPLRVRSGQPGSSALRSAASPLRSSIGCCCDGDEAAATAGRVVRADGRCHLPPMLPGGPVAGTRVDSALRRSGCRSSRRRAGRHTRARARRARCADGGRGKESVRGRWPDRLGLPLPSAARGRQARRASTTADRPSSPSAARSTLIVRLMSLAGTGYFYMARRPRGADKLRLVKYDPRGASAAAGSGMGAHVLRPRTVRRLTLQRRRAGGRRPQSDSMFCSWSVGRTADVRRPLIARLSSRVPPPHGVQCAPARVGLGRAGWSSWPGGGAATRRRVVAAVARRRVRARACALARAHATQNDRARVAAAVLLDALRPGCHWSPRRPGVDHRSAGGGRAARPATADPADRHLGAVRRSRTRPAPPASVRGLVPSAAVAVQQGLARACAGEQCSWVAPTDIQARPARTDAAPGPAAPPAAAGRVTHAARCRTRPGVAPLAVSWRAACWLCSAPRSQPQRRSMRASFASRASSAFSSVCAAAARAGPQAQRRLTRRKHADGLLLTAVCVFPLGFSSYFTYGPYARFLPASYTPDYYALPPGWSFGWSFYLAVAAASLAAAAELLRSCCSRITRSAQQPRPAARRPSRRSDGTLEGLRQRHATSAGGFVEHRPCVVAAAPSRVRRPLMRNAVTAATLPRTASSSCPRHAPDRMPRCPHGSPLTASIAACLCLPLQLAVIRPRHFPVRGADEISPPCPDRTDTLAAARPGHGAGPHQRSRRA